MSTGDVLPTRPAQDVELRHGFTLYQVNALSIWAVQRYTQYSYADFDQRLEAAWHAIIEHIYACQQPPTVAEVIRMAWRAIQREVRGERQLRGYGNRSNNADVNAGFERYWRSTCQPARGPEDQVSDAMALRQIWPRLRPAERELIAALAEHEDYGRAAEALGKSRHTYATQLGRARQAFRELWHEGETPSHPWGADRRPFTSNSQHPTATYRLVVRRRAALARSNARQASGLGPGIGPAEAKERQ